MGLFLTDIPPAHEPFLIRLESKSIDIPAGDSAYVVEDAYVLPADVDVTSIYPHAHYLARDMQAIALFPDGTTKRLLWIKRGISAGRIRYRTRRRRAAGGDSALDAVHLRQLEGKVAREVGAEVVGRNGRALDRGAAAAGGSLPC